MKHQFTTRDLIRFLYNELSYLEYAALEKALKVDAQLAEKLENLKASHAKLDEIELMPSNLSIHKILNYSSSSRLEAETTTS